MGKECLSRFLDNIVAGYQHSRNQSNLVESHLVKTLIYWRYFVLPNNNNGSFFNWMLSRAGSAPRTTRISSFNHQSLWSLSAAFIAVLLMRTLRPENSNDLPKETYLVGGKGSVWIQAIRCHSPKFWSLRSMASLDDTFLSSSIRTDHWKVTLIQGLALYTRVFAVRRIWSELFRFCMTSLISSVHIEEQFARIKITFGSFKILFFVITEAQCCC